MGPNIAQRVEGGIDHCAPLVFDAEHAVTGNPADFVRPYSVLSRSCENGGKFHGRDGDDAASAAFAEDGVLSR